MVNITFEFSKDFRTWTPTINGKRIEDFTVAGSYDVRQGYNLGETPRVSTFSMNIISGAVLIESFLEYRFIRIYRDDELVFIGELDNSKNIEYETIWQQSLSVKYTHLLDYMTDLTFGENPPYITAQDNEPVFNLIADLMNRLVTQANAATGFGFSFVIPGDIRRDYTVVTHFAPTEKDKILSTLNDALLEWGYGIRVENLQLVLFDILARGNTGVELLDGAEIVKHYTDTPLELPSEIFYFAPRTDRDVTVYSNPYSVSCYFNQKFSADGDIDLKYQEDDRQKFLGISNVRYNTGEPPTEYDDGTVRYEVEVEDFYVKEGQRKAYRRIYAQAPLLGGFSFSATESVVGDVTYGSYDNSKKLTATPAGFTLTGEQLFPKYVYSAEQIDSYVDALIATKRFKNADLTFYSKLTLAIGDVIRFRDLPGTTARIYEVQDTLQMDGGFTYRAYPVIADGMTFETIEREPEETAKNAILRIYAGEDIVIEGGAYRKPSCRVFIDTQNKFHTPTVTVDNVPYKVYAAPNGYYIDVPTEDLSKTELTVAASVGYSEMVERIPIYRVNNRPSIIEYRYSTSSKDPNVGDFLLAYDGAPLLYDGSFLGFYGGEWSAQIPTGPQYEGQFLWRRTWNYEINDWVYEMLTVIQKIFELHAEPTSYTINNRATTGAVLEIRAKVKGFEQKEATLDAIPAEIGVLEKIGVNFWKITLTPQIQADFFVVTGNVEDSTAQITFNGVKKINEPIYNGILAVPPATVDGGKLIAGDSYLTVDGVPMRWNGTGWEEVKKTDSNYTEIMETGARDWLKNGKPLKQASALFAYFGDLYADNVTTHEMTLTDDGLLKSQNYDPSVPFDDREGFAIKANGDAEFLNIAMRGDIVNKSVEILKQDTDLVSLRDDVSGAKSWYYGCSALRIFLPIVGFEGQFGYPATGTCDGRAVSRVVFGFYGETLDQILDLRFQFLDGSEEFQMNLAGIYDTDFDVTIEGVQYTNAQIPQKGYRNRSIHVTAPQSIIDEIAQRDRVAFVSFQRKGAFKARRLEPVWDWYSRDVEIEEIDTTDYNSIRLVKSPLGGYIMVTDIPYGSGYYQTASSGLVDSFEFSFDGYLESDGLFTNKILPKVQSYTPNLIYDKEAYVGTYELPMHSVCTEQLREASGRHIKTDTFEPRTTFARIGSQENPYAAAYAKQLRSSSCITQDLEAKKMHLGSGWGWDKSATILPNGMMMAWGNYKPVNAELTPQTIKFAPGVVFDEPPLVFLTIMYGGSGGDQYINGIGVVSTSKDGFVAVNNSGRTVSINYLAIGPKVI